MNTAVFDARLTPYRAKNYYHDAITQTIEREQSLRLIRLVENESQMNSLITALEGCLELCANFTPQEIEQAKSEYEMADMVFRLPDWKKLPAFDREKQILLIQYVAENYYCNFDQIIDQITNHAQLMAKVMLELTV